MPDVVVAGRPPFAVAGRPGVLTSAISSFTTVFQQYSAYSPTCRTSLLRDVRHSRLPVVPVNRRPPFLHLLLCFNFFLLIPQLAGRRCCGMAGIDG
ncbi:hypothetical protein [Fundicoccus culcitae]|uniref:Uncharacterized protein n=1 Tax=Fundicoccus culcitae TaxID=2969821 RepID=A0ABY5P3Z0_9LACT|nr:hypothetical protein [Fundicoccus culcitae]UUX33459.1 hypothetical protein NRE15_11195 [Fundicoccus culcitae]